MATQTATTSPSTTIDVVAHLRFGLYGVALGMVLFFAGFVDYGEMFKMFTFADLRLLLAFCSAVAFLAVGFLVLGHRDELRPKPIHKGTLPGGVIFGVGFGLGGACQALAFAQLGAGHWLALPALAGMFIGTWTYNKLSGRVFTWSTGSSCEF